MPAVRVRNTEDTEWGLGAVLAGSGFVAAFTLVVMVGVLILAIGTHDSGEDGDGSAAVSAEGQEVVGTEFAFDPPILRTSSPVELTLRNDGLIFHNLEIEGVDGYVLEANPGEVDTSTIELDPGEYVLWCSVPGHREAGMESTLIVE